MKRKGNLYRDIISMDNLILADQKARKGKRTQYGIKQFDKDSPNKLKELHTTLKNKEYKTSKYTTFKIREPKERIVYRLPYFPDRIVHHAAMNHLEHIFTSMFTRDTYSCIKGRGIFGAHTKLKEVLKDKQNTMYYLQLDIKKFYPSVDHKILKNLLRRKIKDNDLLRLLDEIIDSAEGLPIGNYLSQYFANFYLTYFDHWMKEAQMIKYYFRYADDMIILHSDKKVLHKLRHDIKVYLNEKLKLTVKANYRVAPTSCGINAFGYVYFTDHIRLRKPIKKNFARTVKKQNNERQIPSYLGWAKHCNAKNLVKKLLTNKITNN